MSLFTESNPMYVLHLSRIHEETGEVVTCQEGEYSTEEMLEMVKIYTNEYQYVVRVEQVTSESN